MPNLPMASRDHDHMAYRPARTTQPNLGRGLPKQCVPADARASLRRDNPTSLSLRKVQPERGVAFQAMKGLLPLPVVIALLRVLRHKPPGEDDDDILFDEFDAVGCEQILAKASTRLLGPDGRRGELSGGNGYGVRHADVLLAHARLEALLVDMFLTHKRLRDQREMEAA